MSSTDATLSRACDTVMTRPSSLGVSSRTSKEVCQKNPCRLTVLDCVTLETGNELGAYLGTQGYPPISWTNNIAGYIKSMSQQLVIDGSDGFYSWSSQS